MEYPRILIFTLYDIFKDNSSVSFTVRSFLEKWPRKNVIQILCEDFNSGSTGVVEPGVFRLGHQDVMIGSWLFKGRREVKTVMRSQLVKKSQRPSFFQSVLRNIRSLVVELYGFLPYKHNKELDLFIENLKPNFIYCNTSSPRMYRLCSYYSDKLNIPFFPHIMDDWPNIIGSSTKLAKPLNSYYKRYLSSLFKKTPAVFCISEYMCEEYRDRYQYNGFVPLMHSVEASSPNENTVGENGIKYIAYAGSLYLERNETIMKLAASLIKKGLGDNYRILVFAPNSQWNELSEKFAKYANIEYGGFVSQQELEQRLKTVWALALIESFDQEMLEYTRFSMSTKVPEYLASGKPIIAIGNESQGSIKYIKENNAGFVVTNYGDLDNSVEDFLKLKNFEIIKENAMRLYENNHRKDKQQEKFIKIVSDKSL